MSVSYHILKYCGDIRNDQANLKILLTRRRGKNRRMKVQKKIDLLKGLAQAKIIKKSVILFRALNMTI